MPKVYGTLEGGREILLTFDDGPHPKWTPILLDHLREENIKAVFFVLGSKVANQAGRDIVRRAAEEGHQIGNHSYSHADLTRLDAAGIRDEIVRTRDLIEDVSGSRRLFRPPYGAHNSTVDAVLKELGYTLMLWSVDPEDWKKSNQPAGWIKLATESIRARGHAIVLTHDIHKTTVQNFPKFVDAARSLPQATFIAYM
jgi:peptidoglycan-N-acetylglucosamine deacetylase